MGEDRPTSTFATRILLASLSASAAETATFPIDTIKTRLQLQLQGPRTGGASRVALDIWRREMGPLGFYRGLTPAVVRHLFYTPIRIVSYEHLRNRSGTTALLPLCGGVSGVVAQERSLLFSSYTGSRRQGIYTRRKGVYCSVAIQVPGDKIIASPADLIKVRMQADGRLVSQGLQPRYSSIADAFRKIIAAEGIRGLWKGVLPNCQRAFMVNMGELSCYDQAKHFIIRNRISNDNIYAHTLASTASGLAATTLSCPADVVKTRMMNQVLGKGNVSVYRNSFDCLIKTIRFEGIMALWKGFFPTWARLGPWQFVFWISYEKLRCAAGLSSF